MDLFKSNLHEYLKIWKFHIFPDLLCQFWATTSLKIANLLASCRKFCHQLFYNFQVYTIARDYRNARLADEETLPKSDKLVNKITDIADLFKAKLHSRIEDKEEWKSIEQQLYSGFMLLLQSCQTKNMKNYLLGTQFFVKVFPYICI